MQDIALAAGVSIKTVSRALTNTGPVRESTRERILAEARRIGFQRNDIAAGLRRGGRSMHTIGVTLGDLSNPFFPPLLRGIHEVAARHGYLVISADSQSSDHDERRYIESLLAQRVAGIIVAPTGTDFSYLASSQRYGAAAVFVDSDPLGTDADSVVTTNLSSTREGVEHLLRCGHRRIAFLGHVAKGYGVPHRWQGYLAALAAADLEVDPAIVRRGLQTEDDAAAAITQVLAAADPPTAVFCDNNRITVGLLRSASFADRRPAVVGFDTFDLAVQLGISVIDSQPYEVGRAGAELLFERLADPESPRRSRTVRAQLHINEDPLYVPREPDCSR